MHPSFSLSLPLPSPDLLAAFEAGLAASLPRAYRDFLLATNGGRPDPCSVPIGRSGGTVLDVFFGLGEAGFGELRQVMAVYAGRYPVAFLPVARDQLGNLVLLGLAGKYRGEVWFWDHEEEASDGEPASFRNVKRMAKSFGALLKSCYEPDPHSWGSFTDLIHRGNYAEVKALVDSGWDVDTVLEIGQTAVQRVVLRQPLNEAVFRLLVEAGADLGGTLDRALLFNNLGLMRWLLDLGADPNEVNNMGNPLLSQAIIAEKGEAALLLLEGGADPLLRNEFGDLPVETARFKVAQGVEGLEGILAALEERMPG